MPFLSGCELQYLFIFTSYATADKIIRRLDWHHLPITVKSIRRSARIKGIPAPSSSSSSSEEQANHTPATKKKQKVAAKKEVEVGHDADGDKEGLLMLVAAIEQREAEEKSANGEGESSD